MIQRTRTNHSTRWFPWTAFGVLWIAATAAGLVMLTGYASSPGQIRPAPAQWPTSSRVPLSRDRATLVMFAHPRCPCTRASLGELEKIMAHFQDAVDASVVFLQPSAEDDDWSRTDLWRTAAAIPGVRALADVDGAEAQRFRAATSGQTFVYNDRGELLFSGGITLGRGHAGDNPGRDAIESCLSDRAPACREAPVFGCPLAANGA
jgi:hypothetical protein